MTLLIAGMEPRAVVEPRDIAELAATVRDLYAADRAFAFVGGATELELGNAPRALDTVVKTTGCARVIDYAPEDQTITVEAGMTIAAVADVLAKNRQFLALDAAEPGRTTIGGAIATNLSGGRRQRYGSIKDSIVGVEIVRPDGTRARGGGKVVKNVAGFDMPKLMVGSLGTLGAIVSATFRVFPIEQQRAAFVYADVDVAAMMRICEQLVARALVPVSVVGFERDTRYDCVVTFEGFAGGVTEQMRVAASIAQDLGVASHALDAPALAAYEQRERDVRSATGWRVAITAAPTALAAFVATGALADVTRIVYPTLGIACVAADHLDVGVVGQWRNAVDRGSVVVARMPSDARGTLDAWGEPPPAFAIMRRLKSAFDPKDLCNPGRFIGGV